MSETFTQFLRNAAKERDWNPKANREMIRDWQESVERLFAQIRTWLDEADPDGLIGIDEIRTDIREPYLGRYLMPKLQLSILDQVIGIIPKARNAIGHATPRLYATPEKAQGRVDMTDELRRYILYRFIEDGQDVWNILDFNSQRDKRLDQNSFEEALMSYLQ
jgi:hypothetical protein